MLVLLRVLKVMNDYITTDDVMCFVVQGNQHMLQLDVLL